MKSITHTSNNFLVNPIRNLLHSVTQVQHTAGNTRVQENIPERKMKLADTAKQYYVNTGKLEKTKLCIKNMATIRCKMVVKAVLENLGINYFTVELGEVEILGNLSDSMHEQLKSDLLMSGLELLEDKKIILVEKIKRVIVEMIHYSDEQPNINFSDYLSEKLNYSYTYLTGLFSEVKGMSIQHFIILHKIERVKELLVYEEFTLSEIAWKLHYSSVSHLSNQFKKTTGLTPSHFKNMKHKRRSTLDNI